MRACECVCVYVCVCVTQRPPSHMIPSIAVLENSLKGTHKLGHYLGLVCSQNVRPRRSSRDLSVVIPHSKKLRPEAGSFDLVIMLSFAVFTCLSQFSRRPDHEGRVVEIC